MKVNVNIKPGAVGEYLFAALLCLLILAFVMKLWRADFHVPFAYEGDALLHSMFVKGMIDNGWYMSNRFLGMPGGMELYDFPATDNFHMFMMKAMSLVTTDYALVLNLYFILTFPLTVLTSLYVFRQFKVSYFPSLVGSLLYAFLPFHFLRGEHHLFFAAYYMIPLIIAVMIWICSGVSLFTEEAGRRFPRLRLRRDRKVIISLIVCVVLGSSGAYYPFFSCFLLLVAGLSAAAFRKSLAPLLSASLLAVVIAFFVFVNLLPTIIYVRQHGRTQVAERSAGDSEYYGLKVAQLVLPISNHRVPRLARLKERYNRTSPMVNENDIASLGLIGSIGFLILLGRLLFRRSTNSDASPESSRAILDHLSVLNLAALLLATVGGFSSLFAFLVSPQLRSYNRISVFIAFFSLCAVTLLLEGFLRRHVKSGKARAVFYAGLVFLLLIGVLDQTGRSEPYRPDYARVKALYDADAEFVKQIETQVPPQAMIFQLPRVRFPDGGFTERMDYYTHFRGYLNSRALRWSFGAMRDRESDRWQSAVTSQPLSEFVKSIALAGFDGIYLDRNGYSDNGALIESQLSSLLDIQPLVSSKAQLVFFNLTEYKKKVKEQYPAEMPTGSL